MNVWKKGHYNGYTYQAKVNNTPSKYGINDGRILKLFVYQDGMEVIVYERQWDLLPSTQQEQDVLNYLLNKYSFKWLLRFKSRLIKERY